MRKKIELLAPGGDIETIKSAIAAGADAIYCGLNKLNARNRATNIDFEDLYGVLNLAHKNGCKIFLTLNILVVDYEIPYLIRLLNKLINTGIDGIIVQDLGVFYILSTYFTSLKIHASTQLNTHNDGQISFLKSLTVNRVNLSRELNIDEISALAKTGKEHRVKTEIFVHGSYCLSFSGLCYMSSVHSGKSGNRGQCSQPCRDPYRTTAQGKDFPLNLKDNSAFLDIEKLSDAGVDSIKIEGRIKNIDYVYTVVKCWRDQLGRLYANKPVSKDNSDLYKVFNRDFSNGYLTGAIHKSMFIDNPRDHSIRQFSQRSSKTEDLTADKKTQQEKIRYYEEKEDIFATVRNIIADFNIDKIPVQIDVSGRAGAPLTFFVKAPEISFTIQSDICLAPKTTTQGLDQDLLSRRLGMLEDSPYCIKQIKTDHLEQDLFISFKALASLKKQLLYKLNGSKRIIEPIETPFLKKPPTIKALPDLCCLISDPKDLRLCDSVGGDTYFQLPNCSENHYTEFIDLFNQNKQLTPWFPAVLIGEHYTAAVKFLERISARLIVTDNSGIAHEACKRKIPWIAGPFMNSVNSFGLRCLKEKFNCHGAFISNEINKKQLKRIIRPDNFKLYYSMFHPILLMNTRQCLFHQVTGCEKDKIDLSCIYHCSKSSTITNKKKMPLVLSKTKGNYHCIYNNTHFLNTSVVEDLPGRFTGCCIDLREIKTQTELAIDRTTIIELFQALLSGNPDAETKLKQAIFPSTMNQYKRGI